MASPQEVYSLINEIYLILDDGDRRFLNRYGLTPARFYALVHLGDRAGLSLSELSGLLLCDKSNASRIIKAMAAQGLVNRQAHESDGRTMRLYLTPQGDSLRREVIEAHTVYNRERLSGAEEIDEDNLPESLIQLKSQLVANLGHDFVFSGTA